MCPTLLNLFFALHLIPPQFLLSDYVRCFQLDFDAVKSKVIPPCKKIIIRFPFSIPLLIVRYITRPCLLVISGISILSQPQQQHNTTTTQPKHCSWVGQENYCATPTTTHHPTTTETQYRPSGASD